MNEPMKAEGVMGHLGWRWLTLGAILCFLGFCFIAMNGNFEEWSKKRISFNTFTVLGVVLGVVGIAVLGATASAILPFTGRTARVATGEVETIEALVRGRLQLAEAEPRSLDTQSAGVKAEHDVPRYDVALSFAGEDRDHARKLAELLRDNGFSVFYDEYEQATLWGRNLYSHLSDVYQNKARYCIMFISSNYARKLWTKRERESAQARAFRESREYILPLRLDDTELPGIEETVGYVDLRTTSHEEVLRLLTEKLRQPEA